MRSYFQYIPNYLKRLLLRIDSIFGIVVGVILVTVQLEEVGLIILAIIVVEAGYGVFREERIMCSSYEKQIRIIAKQGSLMQNIPINNEKPLPKDESSIRVGIQLEIWSDIDAHTAKLKLNFVGYRHKRWYQIWKYLLSKSKRLFGLCIEGHDHSIYRKHIDKNNQPFIDNVNFYWRGKTKDIKWGDLTGLELALEMGTPKGIWRTVVEEISFSDRGSITTPL